MTIEIEAKMRLVNPAALEGQLERLGASYLGERREHNTYFDHRDGSLKRSDQGLRIRVEQQPGKPDVITLTHKGPRAHGQLKNRTETEAQVYDARETAHLFSVLGFEPVLTFEKHRKRYQLDGCCIDLDSLPYLGDFIEIEGPSEAIVLATRQKLSLDNEPIVKASYLAMLMTHIHEQHITDRVIPLERNPLAVD